jgi:hypothetical protein
MLLQTGEAFFKALYEQDYPIHLAIMLFLADIHGNSPWHNHAERQNPKHTA